MVPEASELREYEIEALILKEIDASCDERPSLQVLIVDSNPKNVATVAAVVLSGGHRANKCHDLNSGLKMAEVLAPHVILIDASLICKAGIDAYREFRQTPIGASAIIVAMGWGLDQQLTLGKLDFDYRLNNPTSPMLLREILGATAARQQ